MSRAATLEPAQRRQIVAITLAALAIFLALRFLPTGTNLSHMDFRVDAKGATSIEFCDPLNPQFIPVVAVRSPVTLALTTAAAPVAGRETQATVTLRTGSGKAILPEDLLVAHTRKLHLLIVDPTLTDYQHVHPEPGRGGAWGFAFTPRASGTYRVFADFTPAATNRGLYGSVDLEVAAAADAAGRAPAGPAEDSMDTGAFERDGVQYRLASPTRPLRAGQPIDLTFSARRADGGPVPLEPVMEAYAHLVAFDRDRSGFAHLHPMETDLARRPDATHPELHFKITIPSPGRYVIWAQVSLAGREQFAPFWFDVR